MKANIIYGLAALAVIGYGIYSLFAYDDLEREQGYFLIPFGIIIAVLVYKSAQQRPGK